MLADQQFSGTDDLGFDVPLESVEVVPLASAPASKLGVASSLSRK